MSGRTKIYETNTDRIKVCSDNMKEKGETARSLMNGISDGFEQIGSLWSGDSHDEYMRKLGELTEKLRRIISEVNECAEDLSAVCGEYERTDSDIEDIVAALSY